MTEQASPLVTFYKQGWENHHQAMVATIASLPAEQLALPVAPHYVSIGELVAHMISARIAWFSGWMGEESSALAHLRKEGSSNEATTHEAAELVAMLEQTWSMISSALDHWTSADLERIISPPASHQAWLKSQGFEEEPPHTRQWIVWHVLEHEIHHGGELSLALGTYGGESFYTW